MEALLAMVDGDASGALDYEEFVAATLSTHQLMKEVGAQAWGWVAQCSAGTRRPAHAGWAQGARAFLAWHQLPSKKPPAGAGAAATAHAGEPAARVQAL